MSSALLPALGLAALAAVLNATGDLAQRHATRQGSRARPGNIRLLLDLLRRPAWSAGVLASLLGLGAHVVALSMGELAAVQPVLILELPLAVVGSAVLFDVRLRRRDWVAVGLLTLGLAVLVVCLHPVGGDPMALSGIAWAAGLTTLGLFVAGLALGARWARDNLRAGLLGTAAGVGYGTTAVLFAVAGALIDNGPVAVLQAWQPYTAIAVGLVSFSFLQQSLASGLLVASTPGLTLLNPIVTVAWGLLLFGEHARTGAWLAGACVGAALLITGTLLLVRSPALHAGRTYPAGAEHPPRRPRRLTPDSALTRTPR